MIRAIVKAPDPLLGRVSGPFIWGVHDPVLVDLVDTLQANAAIGLAAVQIGEPVRALVFKPSPHAIQIMVNPRVVSVMGSDAQKEWCLSYPWLNGVRVNRPYSGVVEWEDGPSQPMRAEFFGLPFRCILHELDHLNGVTIDTHRRANAEIHQKEPT